MILETSNDKIKQICDEISVKTIRPAKVEAQKILDEAQKDSQAIIKAAQKEKEALIESAQNEIMQKRNVAEASLNMAIKQGIAKLKEEITTKLFSHAMQRLLQVELDKESSISKVIDAVVKAIEKEGLDADLQLALAQGVNKDQVMALLAGTVADRLKSENVSIGTFKAGAQITIKEKNLVLEVTDDTLKEILSTYCIDELKEKIFSV
jgi:V/A-type H+/Na+-transporting ATPase subunit E